jgi:DNA ligase (NAD+)
MDGIGEKLVEQLCCSGLVKNIADLYKLELSDIMKLERMAKKSASNVIKEINNTRHLTLTQFISAFGLPRVGPEIATLISSEVKTFEALMDLVDNRNATIESDEQGNMMKFNPVINRLVGIDGIGETVARLVLDGLANRISTINELKKYLEISEEKETLDSGKLLGKTFCITGTLSRPRKEIALSIKSEGGKVQSSISGNLDYLLAGESAGSKLEKAQRLGVKIISEKELSSLIGVEILKNLPEERQTKLGDF